MQEKKTKRKIFLTAGAIIATAIGAAKAITSNIEYVHIFADHGSTVIYNPSQSQGKEVIKQPEQTQKKVDRRQEVINAIRLLEDLVEDQDLKAFDKYVLSEYDKKTELYQYEGNIQSQDISLSFLTDGANRDYTWEEKFKHLTIPVRATLHIGDKYYTLNDGRYFFPQDLEHIMRLAAEARKRNLLSEFVEPSYR